MKSKAFIFCNQICLFCKQAWISNGFGEEAVSLQTFKVDSNADRLGIFGNLGRLGRPSKFQILYFCEAHCLDSYPSDFCSSNLQSCHQEAQKPQPTFGSRDLVLPFLDFLEDLLAGISAVDDDGFQRRLPTGPAVYQCQFKLVEEILWHDACTWNQAVDVM